MTLTRNEGIIPALESAHALACSTRNVSAPTTSWSSTSGRGDKDLHTYLMNNSINE